MMNAASRAGRQARPIIWQATTMMIVWCRIPVEAGRRHCLRGSRRYRGSIGG
jgi:hypothetical protein